MRGRRAGKALEIAGKEGNMKAKIDETCIGCGLCPEICPEVFRMGDDGLAEVIVDEIPEDALDSAREAAERCPVEAIEIVED